MFIQRILLIPPGTQILIPFRTLQFLIRISFAMAINIFQGQTLPVVGIHLEEACYSQRQLVVPVLGANKISLHFFNRVKPNMLSIKKFCRSYI